MKPKCNYKPGPMDCCQTPTYALDPLLPYLCAHWHIWEPAAGEGNLVKALKHHGWVTIATDILTGQDFFDECWPGAWWDAIVTNPPYGLKYDWLEKCYAFQMPFALLMPLEMLGAARAIRMFSQHGIEILVPDKRINFKMPHKGYTGNGAQFPTAWYTWGLHIGKQITFVHIERRMEAWEQAGAGA